MTKERSPDELREVRRGRVAQSCIQMDEADCRLLEAPFFGH